MAFPTTSILTSFTGADEDPLSEGGAWAATTIRTADATRGRCRRGSNRAIRPVSVSQVGESVWATSFGADQEVFCTLGVHSASGFNIYARIQNEGGSSVVAYLLAVNDANGFRFFRLSNTTFTQIGLAITQAVAAGDSMGLVVNGTTLEAWFKAAAGSWTLLGDETDANIAGAGKLGISIPQGVATALDDFGGGAIAAQTPPYANVTIR